MHWRTRCYFDLSFVLVGFARSGLSGHPVPLRPSLYAIIGPWYSSFGVRYRLWLRLQLPSPLASPRAARVCVAPSRVYLRQQRSLVVLERSKQLAVGFDFLRRVQLYGAVRPSWGLRPLGPAAVRPVRPVSLRPLGTARDLRPLGRVASAPARDPRDLVRLSKQGHFGPFSIKGLLLNFPKKLLVPKAKNSQFLGTSIENKDVLVDPGALWRS